MVGVFAYAITNFIFPRLSRLSASENNSGFAETTRLSLGWAVFIIAYIAKGKFSINLNLINHIDNIFDAIGLGLFSVLGVGFGLDEGYADNALFCIFLGIITGVGGGIFRDIMSLSVPLIFKKHIYATASVLGSVTYYYMMVNGMGEVWSITVAMLLTFILRMLATIFKWSMPSINLYEE